MRGLRYTGRLLHGKLLSTGLTVRDVCHCYACMHWLVQGAQAPSSGAVIAPAMPAKLVKRRRSEASPWTIQICLAWPAHLAADGFMTALRTRRVGGRTLRAGNGLCTHAVPGAVCRCTVCVLKRGSAHASEGIFAGSLTHTHTMDSPQAILDAGRIGPSAIATHGDDSGLAARPVQPFGRFGPSARKCGM